jgi:hypothetical protein
MRKLMFLTGTAVGYVLGARAGRERYEQICRITARVRANPAVQQAAGTATQRGNEFAHNLAHTASAKAHSVAGAVADKAPTWMPGSHSGDNLDAAMRTSMMTNGRTAP